jgi:hypothetical protein
MIRDCKKLLWYPKRFRNLLLDRDPKISTGFFIELYPIALRLSSENDYLPGEKLENFVECIIEKFKSGNSFVDVKEFRIIRKCFSYFDEKRNSIEFLNRMKYFLENIDEPIEVFEILDSDLDKQRQSLIKQLSILSNAIQNLNPDLLSDTVFLDQLMLLNERILKLIEKID